MGVPEAYHPGRSVRRQVGHVEPGSKEWLLTRTPKETVTLSRAALEVMQAEIAALKEIEAAARRTIHYYHRPDCIVDLRNAIARYDGWMENPDVRDEVVDRLLAIADALELHDEGDDG